MKNNYNFIFYLYYILVLALTLADLFFLNKVSSSLYFGLASGFIGIVLQIFYNDYKKQRSSIQNTLNNIPKVELLHEEEFYYNFKFLIKNANRNVDITHLSLESPLHTRRSEQKAYYTEFVKIVNKKNEVNFRRVERVSVAKIEWIEKLIKDFSGVTNFSLYCILDPEELRKNDLSDLVSVQRIDDEHTFLIALLEHNSTIGQRDIYIRDKSVTNFYMQYYQNRLIAKSQAIIIDGKIINHNWDNIKNELK